MPCREDTTAHRKDLHSVLCNLAALAAPRSAHTERNTRFFVRLHGWDGNPSQGLAALGTEHGVSTARVFEITETMAARLPGLAGAPRDALSAVGTLVHAHGADTEAGLLEALAASDCAASAEFGAAGLFRALRLAGLDCPFEAVRLRGRTLVLPRGVASVAHDIARLALRLSNHDGLCSLGTLSRSLPSPLRVGATTRELRVIVDALPQVHWVTRHAFWIQTGRNRLVNRVGKIMQVADAVPIADILSALAGAPATRDLQVRPEDLAAVVRTMPQLRLSRGVVHRLQCAGLATLNDAETRAAELVHANRPQEASAIVGPKPDPGALRNAYPGLRNSPILRWVRPDRAQAAAPPALEHAGKPQSAGPCVGRRVV